MTRKTEIDLETIEKRNAMKYFEEELDTYRGLLSPGETLAMYYIDVLKYPYKEAALHLKKKVTTLRSQRQVAKAKLYNLINDGSVQKS